MLEVKGMDNLLKQLEKMNKTPNKVVNKALKTAGELVRSVEVDIVSERHDKWSEKVGRKEIKRYPIKSRKTGSKYVDIGVRAALTKSQKKKDAANIKAGTYRPTHWDRIKGLWYNNWGFHNERTGKYVAGSNWLGEAYDKSGEKAYKIIREVITKEMGL